MSSDRSSDRFLFQFWPSNYMYVGHTFLLCVCVCVCVCVHACVCACVFAKGKKPFNSFLLCT